MTLPTVPDTHWQHRFDVGGAVSITSLAAGSNRTHAGRNCRNNLYGKWQLAPANTSITKDGAGTLVLAA